LGIFQWYIPPNYHGLHTRGRKGMHLLSDLMKARYVALKRTAEDRKEWQKLFKSWKSHTCFSADYSNE